MLEETMLLAESRDWINAEPRLTAFLLLLKKRLLYFTMIF